MEEEIKKLVIDINVSSQEFDKKMGDSLAKLREFEAEIPKFEELLRVFGITFKSFGGQTFDWTNLITTNSSKALTEITNDFGNVFDEITKLQIKGVKGLEESAANLQQRLDKIKLKISLFGTDTLFDSSFDDIQALQAKGVEALEINSAKFQARLNNIRIQFNPFHLDDEKQVKQVDDFFKKLETNFYVHTQNFKAFDRLQQPIADGIKNALDLGIPLNDGLSKTQSALSNFWNTYPYVFESTMLTAKVKEKIDASVKKGLSADEAIAKAGEDLKKAVEFWTPYFASSFKFLADTLALGFEQLFTNEKIKPDFGIQFRKILGSFMSSMGDTLIQQASKMLVIQAKLTTAMSLLGTPAGWWAIAGLFVLGAALKGGGAAMSKTADSQLSGNISVNGIAPGNNGMMTSAQNMTPSYAMQTQSSTQTTNESVLRGGDVFWSGQRYEVIRGF